MTGTLLAIETVVLVLLTVLVAGLLRSHAEILRRLHALGAGLDPDSPASLRPSRSLAVSPDHGIAGIASGIASDIDGTGLRDDAMHVSVVGTGHQTLLAFLTSGCLTCRGFWEAFGDPRHLDIPGDIRDVRIVVVAKDAHEESISALRRLAPDHLTVVMSSEAWEAYRVPGSPYFVLVDGPEGRVRGEGTGTTWPQVWNLLRQATDDSREQIIDHELLSYGIAPGDPSLYRTAAQITQSPHPAQPAQNIE